MKNNMPAIVIGAGPAGLSAALALLRSGREVQVLDQRTKWTGRVCGSFLNAESIHHLKWLGVWGNILEKNPVEVRTVTVTGPSSITTPTAQNGTIAIGLTRKNLEDVLVEAIERAGGSVRTGARVTHAQKKSDSWIVSTSTQTFQTNCLVHADGRFSGAVKPDSEFAQGWYGWNATFEKVQQEPGDLSLHLYPGGYVGTLTFADGTTNVCGLVHRRSNETLLWPAVFEIALNCNTTFEKLMRNAERMTDWQGVGPLPFSALMRKGMDSFLVGDAAAVGDPFMGEGIGRALGAGPMIYSALQKGPHALDAYNRLWKSAYTSRLRTARWLRHSIASHLLYPIVTTAFLHSSLLMKWATSRFHVGYNASQP